MFNPEMLEKLSHLKNESEKSKDRLEQMEITEESGGGLVRVKMNGNRKMLGLEINSDLTQLEKEDLEDLIVVAITRALDKVNEINEQEVMSSAQSLFSGF